MENKANQSQCKEVRTTGKLLSSHSFNAKDVVGGVVAFVIITVMLFYLFDGLNNRSFWGDVYFLKGDLRIPAEEVKLFAVYLIVMLIIEAFATFAYFKMNLDIFDDKIIITTIAKEFTISNEDIVDVKTKPSALVIKTKLRNFSIRITDKRRAYQELRKIIDERRV